MELKEIEDLYINEYLPSVKEVYGWLKIAGIKKNSEYNLEELKSIMKLFFDSKDGIIIEEANEYFDALKENDEDMMYDALADLFFVFHNTSYIFQTSLKRFNLENNNNNITENVKDFISVLYSISDYNFHYFNKNIRNDVDDTYNNVIGGFIMELNNIMFNIWVLDKRIFAKFKQVLKSNYSKFTTDENIAIQSVEAYKNGTHPTKLGQNIDSYYKKVGDYYVIFKSNHKILKSINYKEPNQF